MATRRRTRRDFLKATTGAAAAAATVPYFLTGRTVIADDAKAESKNDRPLVGCIGTGDRWGAVGPQAMRFGDVVAVCDVDRAHAENGQKKVKEIQKREVEAFEDYRKVLDRKDIEVVTIVTPDHWHSKIAIEAMQAGKDVYCEKPLTLTIDEGKQILKVQKQTGLKAIAIVKEGRLGTIKTVQCAIGPAPSSGEIPKADVPSTLNWDMWLGQAPMTDYLQGGFGNNKNYPESRTHYEFRWWYEYSGGKMTDWGAHHIDIAQWAIGMDHSGPTSVEGKAEHPMTFKDGHPTVSNRYNAATSFLVKCVFPNGVEMTVRHDTENGILIEGDKGRIFVSRGALKGKPVEDLADNPLPEDAIKKLYKGKQPGDHMRNFFECIKTREQPISDVETHHRAMSTCHLANIAIRLDRPLKWDPEKEQIVGDDAANSWLKREQRKGYEIVV
jgi:predicted dehydrogenase